MNHDIRQRINDLFDSIPEIESGVVIVATTSSNALAIASVGRHHHDRGLLAEADMLYRVRTIRTASSADVEEREVTP